MRKNYIEASISMEGIKLMFIIKTVQDLIFSISWRNEFDEECEKILLKYKFFLFTFSFILFIFLLFSSLWTSTQVLKPDPGFSVISNLVQYCHFNAYCSPRLQQIGGPFLSSMLFQTLKQIILLESRQIFCYSKV